MRSALVCGIIFVGLALSSCGAPTPTVAIEGPEGSQTLKVDRAGRAAVADTGTVAYIRYTNRRNNVLEVFDAGGTRKLLEGSFFSSLSASDGRYVTLVRRGPGEPQQVVVVDPKSGDAKVLAESSFQTWQHASMSSDRGHVAVIALDSQAVRSVTISVLNVEAQTWRQIAELPTAWSVFINRNFVYVDVAEASDNGMSIDGEGCLVARFALDGQGGSECVQSLGRVREEWRSLEVYSSKLLAVCEDGTVVSAWGAPQHRPEHLVVADLSGEFEILAHIDLQQSTASYTCGVGGTAIHAPGSSATVLYYPDLIRSE